MILVDLGHRTLGDGDWEGGHNRSLGLTPFYKEYKFIIKDVYILCS